MRTFCAHISGCTVISHSTGRSRHRAAWTAGLILLTIAATTALAGCSSSSSSGSESAAPGTAAAAHPAPGAPTAVASASAAAGGGFGPAATTNKSTSTVKYVPGNQELIYTAQLTVRAKNVSAAVTRATRIVTSAGGYVSAENAASNPGQPGQPTATIQLKIPVAGYPAALAELDGGILGTVVSAQQQAQDMTEQVADVDSQVVSDEAAIAQLRALLARAGSVSDLLTVQDQVNAEESSLESMQAQQKALNNETAYATVTVTVLGPAAAPPQRPKRRKPVPAKPPGLAGGLSGGWRAFRLTLDWLLAVVGAVAPFAAGLAVLAYLGYLGYRRRRRGRAGAGRPLPAGSTDGAGGG